MVRTATGLLEKVAGVGSQQMVMKIDLPICFVLRYFFKLFLLLPRSEMTIMLLFVVVIRLGDGHETTDGAFRPAAELIFLLFRCACLLTASYCLEDHS